MQDKTSTVEKRNFRIAEFAKAYRIGISKTYMEIKAGRLRCFKVGRSTLISREAAEAWQSSYEKPEGISERSAVVLNKTKVGSKK